MNNWFSWIFAILLIFDVTLKYHLNLRQKDSILKFFNRVPEAFSKQITLEEHQKAGRYSQAKLQLARVELFFGAIVLLFFTFGGGINMIGQLSTFSNYPLTSQVCLIIAYSISSSVLFIPFSYYSTFKIEQEFGFNKMTIKLFIADLIKGTIIALLIGTPLLYLVIWLMQNLASSWWLWVWLVLVVFNLLILLIYPTFIAPLFNKFTPLEDLELKTKIETLLERCGFKSQGVFVMDGSKRSSHGNAYFTGLGSSKRIVFFDTLLKQLSHDEIIAVLAHELGHFKHKHIIKQMVISFGITLVGLYLFSLFISHEWFYNGMNVSIINNASGLILLFIITNLVSLPLAPISSFMSRKNEFEADDFAKKHSNSKDLINGLVKLYRDNASTLTPDDLYVKFYYSHPPASTRIANLEK
ncbi:M48 family metallopeptidase [Aquella oligotrophica]|uniref:Peptidase M48 n=1 Tax=Aquella oligotrophica TaxID=2067065 RepID=A0A2I7N805_9NEIS|nr:M48 family metallopeptidase [Aquella oligotrophica]AUR52593.1 peptidase M48 [Aquella oligotrophica]